MFINIKLCYIISVIPKHLPILQIVMRLGDEIYYFMVIKLLINYFKKVHETQSHNFHDISSTITNLYYNNPSTRYHYNFIYLLMSLFFYIILFYLIKSLKVF